MDLQTNISIIIIDYTSLLNYTSSYLIYIINYIITLLHYYIVKNYRYNY